MHIYFLQTYKFEWMNEWLMVFFLSFKSHYSHMALIYFKQSNSKILDWSMAHNKMGVIPFTFEPQTWYTCLFTQKFIIHIIFWLEDFEFY